MPTIGAWELALIAVVALVVLGPERLPGAARTVGAYLRRARDSWNRVKVEVERELAAEDLKRRLSARVDLPEPSKPPAVAQAPSDEPPRT